MSFVLTLRLLGNFHAFVVLLLSADFIPASFLGKQV